MKHLLFYNAYLRPASGSSHSSFPTGTGEREVQVVQSNVTTLERAATHPTVHYY